MLLIVSIFIYGYSLPDSRTLSRSGSMQVLKEYGEVTITSDNYLIYKTKDNWLSSEEIDALNKLDNTVIAVLVYTPKDY